jgi:membrane protein YdbS with pleckstrin-like domain
MAAWSAIAAVLVLAWIALFALGVVGRIRRRMHRYPSYAGHRAIAGPRSMPPGRTGWRA